MTSDDGPQDHEQLKDTQKDAAQGLRSQRPSQVTEVYWLYATRVVGNYPSATRRSGKWLLFIANEDIDKVWEKVKQATEAGMLGGDSKVSTAKPNPNAVDPSKAVICAYTYDSSDETDIMRVRDELRKLGFVSKIPYKTDEATMTGRYRSRGDTRMSLYYR